MTDVKRVKRVRWGIRSVLVLGVAASTVANVLHANDNPVSQSIAAWPPLALLITIEVISRVPVHRRSLAVVRMVATATIAGIAAWVSYWHMAGVAARYGETGASPYLLPLSVDGLVVVASICLVELSGRIRALEESTETVVLDTPVLEDEPVDTEPVPDPWPVHSVPFVPPPVQVDKPQVDKVSTPKPQPKVDRKTAPTGSSEARVVQAHMDKPDATNEELAKLLAVSTKTVQRYRPPKVSRPVEQADKPINGHVPELETV